MTSEFKVRVADAMTRDVGSGVARINRDIMKKIGVKTGDVIEIKGRRSTFAAAWPSKWGDRRKNIIRIDDLTRKNSECLLNDEVTISKVIKVRQAEDVVFAPVETSLNADSHLINYVKPRIINRPLIEGDSVARALLCCSFPTSKSSK